MQILLMERSFRCNPAFVAPIIDYDQIIAQEMVDTWHISSLWDRRVFLVQFQRGFSSGRLSFA